MNIRARDENDTQETSGNDKKMKNANKNAAGSLYESQVALFKHLKYEHLFAGISGGAISTLILHPLDLLKIRFAGTITNISESPRNNDDLHRLSRWK